MQNFKHKNGGSKDSSSSDCSSPSFSKKTQRLELKADKDSTLTVVNSSCKKTAAEKPNGVDDKNEVVPSDDNEDSLGEDKPESTSGSKKSQKKREKRRLKRKQQQQEKLEKLKLEQVIGI